MKTLKILQPLSIFCLICCAFLNCAQSEKVKKKPSTPKISLVNDIRIAFIPFQNQSKLEQEQNWPSNPVSIQKLQSTIHQLVTKIHETIKQSSQLNRISLVSQDEFPDYRILVVIDEVIQNENLISLPVNLEVYNQNTPQQSFKVKLKSDVDLSQIQGLSDNGYLFWQTVLVSIEKKFPYSDLKNSLFENDELSN